MTCWPWLRCHFIIFFLWSVWFSVRRWNIVLCVRSRMTFLLSFLKWITEALLCNTVMQERSCWWRSWGQAITEQLWYHLNTNYSSSVDIATIPLLYAWSDCSKLFVMFSQLYSFSLDEYSCKILALASLSVFLSCFVSALYGLLVLSEHFFSFLTVFIYCDFLALFFFFFWR